MKKLLIALLIFGCAPSFVIPDEPHYRNIGVYKVENLVCFDEEGTEILRSNITALKQYSDKLRGILEGLRK